MAFDVMPPSPSQPGPTVPFLGVDFTPWGPDELLEAVTAAGMEPFGYLVTPNVDHLVRLSADPSLASLYERSWANVCDSRIVELLARASGPILPAAPGSDLAARLLGSVITAEEPVTVIGGDSALIEALRHRYGLKDLRWHAPPMGLRGNPEAIAAAAAFVAASPARFHFLCVGSPQQELVAAAVLARGDARGLGLCLGASLDFLTGRAERAPVWMQKARLEWLHRLASEPRRMWRRYLVEGPKILGIWLRWRAAARV
jgi:N-acetylglucosaminyldiphosphoundecaprenol N-acetyl-beta-D-mannosaminyltransferase